MSAQKWTQADALSPTVPWLWPSDFWVGPRALWDYERDDQEYRACYPVTLYGHEGVTTAYLQLHAIRGNGNDGGEITLAIADTQHFDEYAKAAMALIPAHSNPRRRDDDG